LKRKSTSGRRENSDKNLERSSDGGAMENPSKCVWQILKVDAKSLEIQTGRQPRKICLIR
jgi:hypothetical protein